MIRCVTTHIDMLRSSLVDRPKPLAIIIQNGGLCPVLSAQSLELPRPRWRKPPATGAPQVESIAPVVWLASPVSALSP